jgi:hypothetical protein
MVISLEKALSHDEFVLTLPENVFFEMMIDRNEHYCIGARTAKKYKRINGKWLAIDVAQASALISAGAAITSCNTGLAKTFESAKKEEVS